MTTIIDRMLIAVCCIIMLLEKGINFEDTVGILLSVILSCIFIYFDNRAVSTALIVVYAVLCIGFKEFIYMMPLIVYEVWYIKKEYVIVVYAAIVMFTGISFNNVNIEIILILAVSFVLCKRTIKYNKKEKEFINMQDAYLELKTTMELKQAKILTAQDKEIHFATLAERNRIAREIHDSVGHMLSRSILQVGALCVVNKQEDLNEQLMSLKVTLDTAMNSIRESVHDLKDEAFDLKAMVDKMAAEYPKLSIMVDYDLEDTIEKDLKYCFAGIIKEALTNTIKHSNADKVNIVLREHPALYQLMITDNGTVKSVSDKEGIGLENMRERVEAFRGTINIDNKKGFKIFISINKNKI